MKPAVRSLAASRIPSPVGPLVGVVDADGALVRLEFGGDDERADRGAFERELRRQGAVAEWIDPPLAEVRRQLAAYFAGRARGFELERAPFGTAFQRRVWDELVRIPFGATISYGELARRIGSPTSVRAVARANATNPIAIVVPCHRVIGADGTLTGYAGGLERKRFLLELEGASFAEAGRLLFP